MFARPFSTTSPRHSRLFELIRQGDFATLVNARREDTEPFDARAYALFLERAQRSLR
ncbi:hypothetical protein G5B38_00900 [Pseudohalocynthiibacter aestuariivivens]|uniref:Uncharacterized protein n=1 Tax=Roseovarius pelagicus TaxID=2980108 RepID=A0ABY6DCM3_9RHOB|nr:MULTISPECIES: hypothetical protein [Rhodobacterales]QIE44201.1 hypothetical protein G5B38_00900 [Pseudohalocynthiibacter aestuariivivens]UXX83896.1 hypothetical protein N7U68_04345 [Roseovarius pelagicus]